MPLPNGHKSTYYGSNFTHTHTHTHVHTHNMLCCSAKRWGYDYNVDNQNIK